MAIPTQPTAAIIVTEALSRKLNGATPATADVTRATSYGLEMVKRAIMNMGHLWKPLILTTYDVSIEGVSRYANDSDFEKYVSITIMEGSQTGTLSAVTDSQNFVLAADEDVSKENAEGKFLLITSGTGVDQCEQIDDYTVSTKAVKLRAGYSTEPDTSSTYLICDEFRELEIKPMFRREGLVDYGRKDKPSMAVTYPDSTYGYFELYPVPDAVYGIKKTYFSDLRRLDITGDLYSTLLRRWAGVLEQGVYVWSLGEDDDRYPRESAIFAGMLQGLRARDLFMMDESNLQRTVDT